MTLNRYSIFAALLLAIGASVPIAAQGTDIIRGRVLGQDSLPRAEVRITAASRVTADTRTTLTDKNGHYTLIFPDGGGDYLMVFQQIGWLPVQRQVKRVGDEDVLVANVSMRVAPTVLDSVIIIAGRIRPPRFDGDPTDPTASEALLSGNGLPPAIAGSLAALAGDVAGVTRVPGVDGAADGFSVLGLSPDQNRVTLNGMTINASDLPRDAITGGRVTTTTADPSRGGFSGAVLNVQSRGGTTNVERYFNFSLDDSRLQVVDKPSTELGAKYANLQLSGRASGPIRSDKSLYAASVQFGRRTSDVRTLLNTPPLALRQFGASTDSASRAVTVMDAAGLPATDLGIPPWLTTTNASTVLRGDWRPSDKHNLSATLTTSWKVTESARLSALAMPTHGGEDHSLSNNLQLSHSVYFGTGFLHEVRAGLNASRTGGDPYLGLPDVRVRVRSTFPDDASGVATLQLGGNSSIPARSKTASVELFDDLSWITVDNKHRLKLSLEFKADRFDEDQTANRLGTFSFNSLAEFENGQPSEFRRQLSESHRTGDLMTAAIAIGDQHKQSKDLLFQYGLRLDGNRYGVRPQRNAAVDSAFGVRNDAAPDRVGLSPRFGFTWTFGTTRQIAAFEGAQRTPRSTVRGSVGEYRNALSSSLLQSAISATGLPNGIQQLNCRGEAVPVPDWVRYTTDVATVPVACADGTGATVFADALPSVTLFGGAYGAPRSWRANLAWTGSVFARFNAAIEGTYSLNLDQSGSIDLNFRDSTFFALGAERDRPVFVAPSSISRTTGAIGSRAARRSAAFSQVTERTSDLKSRSAQLKVSISPLVSASLRWSVTYVYSALSEMRSGFGGNTGGSPLIREWGPGLAARHQFNPSVTFSLKAVSVGITSRISSGIHFTPMVSGDVNGDGSSNDRAFVFDPAQVADTALASAMRTLLESARPEGRRCLNRELGQIARRGSCQGPWTATVNVNLSVNPAKLRLPHRTVMSINFNNPLALVDMLVNGKASAGSLGQEYNPETTLLYVRGFDATAGQFRYEANPRFADTRASRAGGIQPFQVTLSFRTEVGPEVARQNLQRTLSGWSTGKPPRPTEQQLKQQYENPFVQPYQNILKQRDSLKFTAAQTDSIGSLMTRYTAALDAIWVPVATFMAHLSGDADVDDAFRRIRQAQRQSYDLQARHGPAIKRLLTPDQLRRLPASLTRVLDEKLINETARAAGVR